VLLIGGRIRDVYHNIGVADGKCKVTADMVRHEGFIKIGSSIHNLTEGIFLQIHCKRPAFFYF
jgi:hypothetical protein